MAKKKVTKPEAPLVKPEDVKAPRRRTKTGKLDSRGRNPTTLANLKPFKKGQSGNPKGAKKGRTIRGLIKDILELEVWESSLESGDAVESQVRKVFLAQLEDKLGRKLQNKELMIFKVMGRILQHGDVSAFNALMDRLEGKPVQHNINENTSQGYWELLGYMAEDKAE